MYSITTLMDVVAKKNQFIKNALIAQTKYQLQLDDNIKEIKHEIQLSFERLLSDVQCRKQHITDAADAIYKLKKMALINRIDALKSMSCDLKECLDVYHNGSSESETIQIDMIKNIFNKTESQNLEFTDDAILTWSCDEYQLKEMIKNYGAIDIKNQIEEDESENDFELVPQCQSSQMKEEYLLSNDNVKKIMGEIEKSDIDKIRHELQSCSIKDEKRSEESLTYFETSSSAIDQVVKEEDDIGIADLSTWLHSVNNKAQIEKEEDIKTSNKVESWLKECSDCSDCQWIAPKNSKKDTPRKFEISFQQFDLPLTHWLQESSTKIEEVRVPSSSNEEICIDNELPYDSHQSRSNNENDWLAPSKRKIPQNPPNTSNSNSWLSSSSSSKSIKSRDILLTQFQIMNDQPSDDYLRSPTRKRNPDDKKIENKRSKFTKKSLAHMNYISNQSLNEFLVKPKKVKIQKEESYCDWLAGKSNDKCSDCTDECAFENKNIEWVKIATDW